MRNRRTVFLGVLVCGLMIAPSVFAYSSLTPSEACLPLSNFSLTMNAGGGAYNGFYLYAHDGTAIEDIESGDVNPPAGETHTLDYFGQVPTDLADGEYDALVFATGLSAGVYSGWNAACGIGKTMADCIGYLGGDSSVNFTVISSCGGSTPSSTVSDVDSQANKDYRFMKFVFVALGFLGGSAVGVYKLLMIL